MIGNFQTVLENKAVIVPPKAKPSQVKFRWPPDVLAEIKEIAERANRSANETAELLMRWAIVNAKTEYDMTGEMSATSPRRSKK